MPFNAMQGNSPYVIVNISQKATGNISQRLQATYPMLRLGFEPRTQVSKTHVLTVYTNRADSIRVPYL